MGRLGGSTVGEGKVAVLNRMLRAGIIAKMRLEKDWREVREGTCRYLVGECCRKNE